MTILENSVHPKTRGAWRQWLHKHHTRTSGLWVIFYKKASGKPRVAYDALVEEALCFGWIDSKTGKLDDKRGRLWFAPRKARTGWSQLNKQRVERLMANRQMTAAGLIKIQAAQADGSWQALDAVEKLEVPPDLKRALASLDNACRHFDAFPRSVKRGILEWILNAKKPETRAKRIAETARLAANNQRANQWPRA